MKIVLKSRWTFQIPNQLNLQMRFSLDFNMVIRLFQLLMDGLLQFLTGNIRKI